MPHLDELPGPAVEEWLNWACSLEDSTNDPDLAQLKSTLPRVDDFVSQLEIEMWQDGSVSSCRTHAWIAVPEIRTEAIPEIAMIFASATRSTGSRGSIPRRKKTST